MKQFLSIVFICFLSIQFLGAQNTDSLRQVWESSAYSDSVRFEAGLTLFRFLFRRDLSETRKLGADLVTFASERNNAKWESAAERYLGNIYAVQGEYENALSHYQKSLFLNQEVQDRLAEAATLSNIGNVYYEMGNYSLATEQLLAGLKMSEELQDKPGISRVTNNLGNVYLKQKDHAKALEYYGYSREIKEELVDKPGLINVYNNIGLVYAELEEYEKALDMLTLSAQSAREMEDMQSVSRANSNIGDMFNRMGRFEEALERLNESVSVKLEIGDREGLAHALLYRGQAFLGMGNFMSALEDCSESRSISIEMGASGLEQAACDCLTETNEKLGNYKEALRFSRRSAELQDSLFNKEITEEITRSEMLYAFEKKQLADSIAYHKEKADQELAFMQNLNAQKNKFNLIVFGGLGLLIIGGIYWRSRQKTKKLEHERAVNARLKQVDQLKDQFLANTSHELRTPLNGIIGITESLKDGVAGPLPPKAVDNLEMIAGAGKRLAYLINDLLDFSRLKNRDLVLSLSAVDLHAVTDVVLKFSETLARHKPVKLSNKVPHDIPLVSADENRLQQILFNLVGNAIKFTSEGEVIVRAREENGQVAVTVSDTGTGIEKDHQERIFESFEQGDGSVVREFGGTGLVCPSAVSWLNSITVQSAWNLSRAKVHILPSPYL